MDFRKNGFSYEMIWKTHGNKKYIKWKVGSRNTWERITEQEYFTAKH